MSLHHNLRRLYLATAMTGALVLTPLMAAASTFPVTLPGTYFGGNGSASATIHDTSIGLTENTLAGGFEATGNLHGTGPETFTAWCLDIVTYMKTSSIYTTTTTPFQTLMSAAQKTAINQLFNTGFSTLNLANGADSGGFQLALWELMNEHSGTYDLTAGNFTATSPAALAKGQALLAGLGGPVTQSYHLTWLQSDDARGPNHHYSQNLVTAATVPLPAGGLLLAAAMGGVACLRRTKANRA